jgi:PAS domain-containing protein
MDLTESLELQKKFRLHSLLLNGTADIAIATDMNGRVIYINEAGEKYFKTSLAEVKDKLPDELFSRKLGDFLASSSPVDVDEDCKIRIALPDESGSCCSVEFTSKVVHDEEENIATVFIGRMIVEPDQK